MPSLFFSFPELFVVFVWLTLREGDLWSPPELFQFQIPSLIISACGHVCMCACVHAHLCLCVHILAVFMLRIST